MCLLPEKRSSSLLTISRGPCACVTSTSARRRIMRAGCAEACEIDRLAARKLVAHMRDPRIGEFRAELVKSRSAHGLRRQPARDAEADGSEPGMSRANSYVRFQPVQPLGLARIGNGANLHQSQLAPGNNAVSSCGISTCLPAPMRLRNFAQQACTTRLGKTKQTGENDAGSHAKPGGPDGACHRRHGRHHSPRAEEIRFRRQRYRNQDRQHHAL